MKSIIIANWKMNPVTAKEAEHLFEAVKRDVKDIDDVEIVICPPYIYLSDFNLQEGDQVSGLKLGAQDCHWEQKGAYTGEISPLMLKDSGCQYVIIGHSERRRYFGETDEIISRKLKIALKARLEPILCVGEEVRDTFDSSGRPLNEMSLAVREQLEKALVGISLSQMRNIIIAYEPIWAIGTGNFCSVDSAMQANLFIKKILSKIYSRQLAGQARIIYGGSVDDKNATDYIRESGMNGLLVGGASLNESKFMRMIRNISKMKKAFTR